MTLPTPRTAQADAAGVVQKTDDKGHTYFELPALSNPFDAWWIYDPRGQYRSR
jgi:hypothetical protein